ncbi:hypothetical protein HID58_007046, partial [Brassica napus]
VTRSVDRGETSFFALSLSLRSNGGDEEETAERRDHEENFTGIFRTSSRDHHGDSHPITKQINWSLSRMKESFATKFKTFQIPVDWMLENGITSQIKLASVKLAMKYMKRVSAELEAIGGGGPEEEELIVQGVRFAFRVHQVKAKGLDHLLLFWFGFVTTFVCPNS